MKRLIRRKARVKKKKRIAFVKSLGIYDPIYPDYTVYERHKKRAKHNQLIAGAPAPGGE